MRIIQVFLVLLLSSGYVARAQSKSPFYLDISGSTVENQTLQSLMDSQYFIQFANKDVGLIRCKTVLKYKHVFSHKDGDVLEFNLLVQNIHSDTVRIQLQANLTEKQRTGSVGNMGYHNNDQGITYESKYYKEILAFLKSELIEGDIVRN